MSLLNKLLKIKHFTSYDGTYNKSVATLINDIIFEYITSNNLTEYYCIDHGVEMKFTITSTLIGFVRNKTNTLICYGKYASILDNDLIETRFDDIENIFDKSSNVDLIMRYRQYRSISLSSALACIGRDHSLLGELYKVRHLKADTHEVNDIIIDYIMSTTEDEYRFTHGSTKLRFLYHYCHHTHDHCGRYYNIVGYICNHNYIIVYSYTGGLLYNEFKGERAFIYNECMMDGADRYLDNMCRSLYSICMDYERMLGTNVTDAPTINEFIPNQTTKSARNF